MPAYWLDLFTGRTWEEFLAAGGTVSGFRESRWRSVQQLKVGDVLLCYLTGLSRFIGALEVTEGAFRDHSRIWKDEDFPCRLRVKSLVTLTPTTAVPIVDLATRLSIFKPDHPGAWTGHVRASPTRWKQSDGEAILEALRQAETNPVERPVARHKLARRPRALRTARIEASVTVPEPEPLEETEAATVSTEAEPQYREHTEIQWLLLKLGSDLGFDVWAARGDKGREWNGTPFADLPRFRSTLPRQFDDATNSTIEHIDVLWLKAHSFIAAFEIESTTSIYSGLLRMADLVAMQPNLTIPLYIVAPDERRPKVISEINRPTFARLSPPLAQICRYIAFTGLREWIRQYAAVLTYMRPEFLAEVSESCEPEGI